MSDKTPDEKRDEDYQGRILDRLLDSMPRPAPASDAFLERLLNIPAAEQASAPASTAKWWKLSSLSIYLRPSQLVPQILPQAVGLAAAGSLGIMLGLSSVARTADPVEIFDTSAYMLGDPGLVRDLQDVD